MQLVFILRQRPIFIQLQPVKFQQLSVRPDLQIRQSHFRHDESVYQRMRFDDFRGRFHSVQFKNVRASSHRGSKGTPRRRKMRHGNPRGKQ